MSPRVKKAACILTVLTLCVLSLRSQWKHALSPFFENRQAIFERLALPEEDRTVNTFPYPLPQLIRTINGLPEGACVYYAPAFPPNAGRMPNEMNWWCTYCALRYFCYPKRVICIHHMLFDADRAEFIRRFVGDTRLVQELPWIRRTRATHVIVFRENRILLLPISPTLVMADLFP